MTERRLHKGIIDCPGYFRVDILAIINLLFPLVHRVVVDTSADYFHGVLSDSEFSILRMDIPENHNKTSQAQGD